MVAGNLSPVGAAGATAACGSEPVMSAFGVRAIGAEGWLSACCAGFAVTASLDFGFGSGLGMAAGGAAGAGTGVGAGACAGAMAGGAACSA